MWCARSSRRAAGSAVAGDEAGARVVAVLSAMGDTTDELLELATWAAGPDGRVIGSTLRM